MIKLKRFILWILLASTSCAVVFIIIYVHRYIDIKYGAFDWIDDLKMYVCSEHKGCNFAANGLEFLVTFALVGIILYFAIFDHSKL